MSRKRVRRCTSVGCGEPAVTTVEMSMPRLRDERFTENCCRRCANSYLRRPALSAVEQPWPTPT